MKKIILIGLAATILCLSLPAKASAVDFVNLYQATDQPGERHYSTQEQDAIKSKFAEMQQQIDDLKKANTDLQNKLNQAMATMQSGQFQDQRFDNLNDRLRKIEALKIGSFIDLIKKKLKIK